MLNTKNMFKNKRLIKKSSFNDFLIFLFILLKTKSLSVYVRWVNLDLRSANSPLIRHALKMTKIKKLKTPFFDSIEKTKKEYMWN